MNNVMKMVCHGALMALFLTASIMADDTKGDADQLWPQWRGTTWSGVASQADPPISLSEEGKMVVLQRGKQFELLSINELDESFYASPAIVGDAIYLRGDKSLYCFSKPSRQVETKPTGVENVVENLKQEVTPLPRAHAHNDYLHKQPLQDALNRGFCSVEADIFLVDGELRVGHSRRELKAGRTLESLYLNPLRKRIAQQSSDKQLKSNSRVHPGGPVFTLMIDIKTDGEAVLKRLSEVLPKYQDVLCRVENGRVVERAIQIVISGDRPIDSITALKIRYVGIDGRLEDLDSESPAHLMPMISDRWGKHFKWRGAGEMPSEERDKLRAIVRKAHEKGRRVRFWATPELPAVWQVLLDEGVDHINTDKLDDLREMMIKE